jgi:hypothetical protein
LENKVYDDTKVLKKASNVITASHHGEVTLEPQDRNLINYLLFRAYNDLSPQTIYRVPTKEAMEYSGIKKHKELQASLSRLGKIFIEIDYIDPSTDEARSIIAHYLSADMSHAADGMLQYAFDAILYHFIAHPKVYAKIYIDRSSDMGSNAAKILYEVMCLQYRKQTPIYRATPDELRKLLEVRDKHPRPDNFRKFVEKTVNDINSIAEFEILIDYVKGGQGGGIVEFVFKAVSKDHARLIEARETKHVISRGGSHRGDRKTIDLLDGKSDEERGVAATLTREAIESVSALLPADADFAKIDKYVEDWHEHSRGKVYTDPNKAFRVWAEAKIEKESDKTLSDLSDDVFGNLLGELIED